MAEAGTKGQTNVTQSNSSGNQKLDISPIDEINNDMSLDDITGLYTNIGHQFEGIASKAAEDVGRRQTELIGNNFGAVNPYNYNEYYAPQSNAFQSYMRMEGTQRALEEGQDRAKKEAQEAANAAQSNYANAQASAQSRLEQLQNAKNNLELVLPGSVGGNTSAEEVLKYAESLNAQSADELYRDVSAHYLSDQLVNGNWNIGAYRNLATANTLNKFGVSEDQYKNFSQAEHDEFWARPDVGAFWTNQYAYNYAKSVYGEDVANEYQGAYEYNYGIIKDIFDSIKAGAEALTYCPGVIKAIKVENKDALNETRNSDEPKLGISVYMTYQGNTYNFYDPENKEIWDHLTDGEKEMSIYNFVEPEEAEKIRVLRKKYNEYTTPLIHDEEAFQAHQKDADALVAELSKALKKSEKAAINKDAVEKISFVNDYENVNNMIESAFGADYESINFLMNLRVNNPQQFEDLVHDYALVTTYGQIFEIADGKKTYHTASGDKVLEEGTYVMYTLPGFQDANGNFLEPNLKRYMELRKETGSADMDDEKLAEEQRKALEGYSKVVMASLTAAAYADVDVTPELVHSIIYAANPKSDDAKTGVIYGGHTVKEILEEFNGTVLKNPEKAYTLFTKIINKASSVSGSLMANYNGQLTTMKTTDSEGRPMVGSELSGTKESNTLFTEGDIDNLTVDEAVALWGVISASMGQYRDGDKTGNINPSFLNADATNWIRQTSEETVKGFIGIVDLVGNIAWAGTQLTGAFFNNMWVDITGNGQKITAEDWRDNLTHEKRWWGTGGITGNWTGAYNAYEEFLGDYKEGTLGYGSQNQNRMTDNLNHLVSPILEDMWFGDDQRVQDAMGKGQASDEGFNLRAIRNFSSSLVGLVFSIVLGNAAAKGIGAAGKGLKTLSLKLATSVKGKFARNSIYNGAKAANTLMNAANAVANSPADDITRVVENYLDDAARAASNMADDAANILSNTADDIVNASDDVTRTATDILDDAARNSADNLAAAMSDTNARIEEMTANVFSEAADDGVRALGTAAASVTDDAMAKVYDGLIDYSKVLKETLGNSYSEEMVEQLTKFSSKYVTKEALNLAHLSAYSGLSIDDISHLDINSQTILSNLATFQSGGYTTAEIPKDLLSYMSGMSKESIGETIMELSERAAIRAKAGGVWTTDDTIRYLARNGWDSKRLTLLTKDWLSNQLQDMATDMIYGYIKPTVTNEGTDRETIEEYLTNPLNYALNFGAAGLQWIGGRALTNMSQSITDWRLDRARKALDAASTTGATNGELARRSRKVMKLVDKANSLADKALERGKTLEDIKDLTGKASAYADEAMDTMNAMAIRNLTNKDMIDMSGSLASLSDHIESGQMGYLDSLFKAYNAGIVKSNAQYFEFKKIMKAENKGLGSIMSTETNGRIWTDLFDGRHAILRELDIPRAEVTVAEQKKIYAAMVNHVMSKDYAKTIPGLRTSLEGYFDTLINMAERGGYDKLRAGYLPIESMLNTNRDVSAGIRGFSSGEFVLHTGSANPYLERSEGLKDTDVVAAILKGDKEIKLKDSKGNYIVDELGNIKTRELNPEGLNFLDSITNAYNAKTFHDYIDPIVGRDADHVGLQALANAQVIINQKGAMGTAIDKTIAYYKKTMENIETKAFKTPAEKAANTKVKASAKAKMKKVDDENPYIKRTVATNKVVQQSAAEKLESLRAKKTNLTSNQQDFLAAALYNYTNATGRIDTAAGGKVFDTYKNIVKQDIKDFQAGKITVDGNMNTPFYRTDKFSWQYDAGFNQKVDGFSRNVKVTSEYYALLKDCVQNNITEPSKDMVMKRLLATEKVAPVDKDGKIFSSTSKPKNPKVKPVTYEWQSPLKYFRTSYVTDDAASNMAVRNFNKREISGWTYEPEKGKFWDAKKFDSLVLDSPENISHAKNILFQNVEGLNAEGVGAATKRRMVDLATQDFLARAQGGSGLAAITPTFSEYVEFMSTAFSEKGLFMGAFDENSGYKGIFTRLNSYENNGGSLESFEDYLIAKIKKGMDEGVTDRDAARALYIVEQVKGSNTRASSLGDNWDSGKPVLDEDATPVIFNSSDEAITQNELAGLGDPYKKSIQDINDAELDAVITSRQKAHPEMVKALQEIASIDKNPKTFAENLKYFSKELDDLMTSETFSSGKASRTSALNKSKKLVDDTNELIKKAAKTDTSVQKKIKEYAGQRQHRQKAYNVNQGDSKYDYMKAYGATNEGYTLTDSPAQFRTARQNVNIYDENATRFTPMKEEFDNAVKMYKQAIAEERQAKEMLDATKGLLGDKPNADLDAAQARYNSAHDAKLKAQGYVDQTRKTWHQAMTDAGMDFSEGGAQGVDWSGYGPDYDRMMLIGGTIEGRIDQSINALEQVRSSAIKSNSTPADLINDIDAQLTKLKAFREEIPSFERTIFATNRGSSQVDSMEMGLVFAMNQTIYGDGVEQSLRYMIDPSTGEKMIVASKPSNGWFTNEQLNAIGGATRGIDKTGSGIKRLGYSQEGGKPIYNRTTDQGRGRTTFEFNGDDKAYVEITGIGFGDNGVPGAEVYANGDYVDVAKLPATKVIEINTKNFDAINSPYRYAIVDYSAADVDNVAPSTKTLSYGKSQAEFEKLSAANNKAQAILKYKESQASNPGEVTVEVGGYRVKRGNTDFQAGVQRTKKLAKELELTDSDLKRANNMSLGDARTDAWIANAELEKFTKSHKQTVVDVKSIDAAKKLKDLKAQESSALEEMKTARGFGDLSENEEYRSARQRLAQIRNAIAEIEGPKNGKPDAKPKYNKKEAELVVSIDDIKTVGEAYGKYNLVRMKGDNWADDADVVNAPLYSDDLDYQADTAYTEWLAFSKDEEKLQNEIERLEKKVEKISKKADKTAEKVSKEKVADPDDASKKVSLKSLSEESYEGKLKEKLSKNDYEAWKKAKEGLEYANSIKSNVDSKGKFKAAFFRDHNGALYLADNSPNLAGYSTYLDNLEARGWKPVKKGQEIPPVDEKLDKKAQKTMNKAITKNRHAGDIIPDRAEDWQVPRDKKGNIILDAASKNSTLDNMETIYNQVRKTTGIDIDRKHMLMRNEYADLLTRITDESTNSGKLQNVISAVSNVSQSIQNFQLAGGASFVNALTIAQMRGAIMQDPRAIKEYVKIVGSMRNSRAVSMYALDNLPLLSRIALETGDMSILNDLGPAISARPGVTDGGVLQNMVTNTLNLKKDFIQARIDNDGSIPKALKSIVGKDLQNTIFEDATFRNAIPVLRAKMLTENYDAALNQLRRKFSNMDPKVMEKAALQMSYAKTTAFFNPYDVMNHKMSTVLDNTYTKKVRDFAATFTNSKSQTTILDMMTNFFFALRYKMMLAGRVYDAVGSAPSAMKNAVKGAIAKEATDDVLDSIGTAFMHSGSVAGVGSLAACAVVAAASAKAMGIPTAWDDASWIDEYDGSFKIPDVLLKFQTIGQIWLPNKYTAEEGFSVDPTQKMYGIDTMSSIFTLQNSFFRTIDRTINPETYYAAPQRGIGLIGQEVVNPQGINNVLNSAPVRAIGDELIASNLLSPFKAMHEVIVDSTYFGNNIWEKKYLPDGKENPNYDPGRNFAAVTMHILGLDQALDGGQGYNGWVKGQTEPGYVEQDQIGTVKGSGILQHEFWTAAVEMMEGKYLEAIYEAGELPIKVQNLSSKARTEFNTRVKNIIAGYNDEYKAIATNVDSNNDDKDAAYAEYAKKAATAVATWSKKYNHVLGEDQKLVPYVTRTLMAMVSGEYDDNMYYVQDAYWKASEIAQIEGVTGNNYWLDDEDLKDWIAQGKTAEEFAKEKDKRTRAYNQAQDDEYDARKALIEANIDNDGNEMIKGLKDFLTDKYSYSDLKAEQRTVNKEIFTSIQSKLDSKQGDFDNMKEAKAYYEALIDGTSSTKQKVNIAMRYNTYVFDLVAPYAEKYGANIVSDGYYNGTGLANYLADYVILPADQKYYGKSPVANYIKDVFNVGYRNGKALPTDEWILEKFVNAQNLMYKGAIASSVSVLDTIIDSIKKGRYYASDSDYNKIINMRAILSARSK